MPQARHQLDRAARRPSSCRRPTARTPRTAGRARALLDILHLLAHLLEFGLDADDGLRDARRRRPSSRSCSLRGSSPAGGSRACGRTAPAPSVSDVHCATCARNRTTSSLMSERAANRTTSWATRAGIDGQVGGEVARRASARRSRSAASPAGRRRGDLLRPPRARPPCARRGRRCSMRAFVAPHRRRARRARASTACTTAASRAARPSVVELGRLLAHRQRLREPQQVARQRARPATRPALARLVERLGQRRGERLVDRDRQRRLLPQLHRHGHFDPPARRRAPARSRAAASRAGSATAAAASARPGSGG